jgi:hypothetical protein
MPVTRVLVATPCGGGDVTTNFLASYQATMAKVEVPRNIILRDLMVCEKNLQAGSLPPEFVPEAIKRYHELQSLQLYEVGLYTLAMESLLARGRSHCAQKALTEGWDKLLFIDSDQGWTPEQFLALIQSPYPITCGAVPLKTYPIVLNFLPFKQDQEKYWAQWGGLKTPEGMWLMSFDKGRYIKVARSGTGMMCIDVKVLKKMAEKARHFQYPNPATGYNETHYAFFQEGAKEGQDDYYSEDWAFCALAQECGYDIVVDTDVVVTHRGQHVFQAPPKPTKEQYMLNRAEQMKQEFMYFQQLKAKYETNPVEPK